MQAVCAGWCRETAKNFSVGWIDHPAVARYVIGTAAALSNDFPLAEQLLLDSERRIQQFVGRAEGAALSVLLDRVRKRLADLYAEWLARLGRRHTRSRDVAAIRESEEVIAKLRRYTADAYGVHLAAAIVAFVLHRDIETARRESQACSGSTDATWRYSEAFLHAYDGDLESAYRSYRRAFESPLRNPNVPTQVEEFIQTVIDEEPERQWLYYCLGLVNFPAKGDLEAARNDFQRFVDSADTQRFNRHIEIARQWIEEIDVVLGAA